MTIAIIIAAVAGFLPGIILARRGYAGWLAEITDHTASLKMANAVNAKLKAEITRLNALQQPRHPNGRFLPKHPSHTIKQEVR